MICQYVVDLDAAFAARGLPVPIDMPEFFARGAPALALAREAAAGAGSAAAFPKHAVGDVVLRAPIGRPPKIVCIGMNYVDHCTEQNFPIPTEPVIFNKVRANNNNAIMIMIIILKSFGIAMILYHNG